MTRSKSHQSRNIMAHTLAKAVVISYGWQVSWPDQVVVYGPELLDGVASPNLLHCVEVRRLLVLLVRVFLPILVSQRACVRSVLLKRLGRLAPAHIEEREPRMKGSTLGLGVGQVGQVTGSVGKVRLSGLDTRPVRGVYDRIFFHQKYWALRADSPSCLFNYRAVRSAPAR